MRTRSTFLCLLYLLASGSIFSQVTYTGKPMYQILVKRAGVAIGSFTVELFPNIAYRHARNFDSLATLTPVGFYDTTAFHRVIPGFMIQGGDPNSRSGPVSTWGQGQAGQPTVKAEFSKAKHVRGILSAARSSNINSATSQFFICVATAAHLDNNYSVYGRTLAGMNIVDTIVSAPRTTPPDRPNQKHEMFITYVGSNDSIPQPPVLEAPRKDSVEVDSTAYLQLKWKGVSDGILYQLALSTDSTFNTTDTLITLSNLSIYYNKLLPFTKHFWRVRTNNGGHYSVWSPTWNFRTMLQPVNGTNIKTIQAVARKVSVYPNPGNGNFTFYDVIPGSHIRIFDQTGRLVYETTAANAQVPVNLENRDKGIYFYKVSVNGIESAKGRMAIK